ncbi:MAG: methyltransferase [Aggregatilineales bacterium]
MRTTRVGSVDPAIALLIEEAPLEASDRVVILNGIDPALAVAVGRTASDVAVYAASAGALAHVQGQIAARHTSNVNVSDGVFPGESTFGTFDVALLPLPKGRDYARALIWSARRALRPDGKLYIAGPGDGGIKSALADAAVLFGGAVTLTTRKRCRIGVAKQPSTFPEAYPAEWGTDATYMQQFTIANLPIWSMPGVFSWQGLDDGTAFLLDNLSIVPGERVLDVGCGYGVIGLTAAVRGAGEVTLTDDSLLAAGCAHASVESARCANVTIVAGDLFDGLERKQKFDLIVSNPPFHQGLEADTNVARRLIRESGAWLAQGGRLIIVGNVFLRYDRLIRESFPHVRTVAENTRYAVWEAKT